MMPQELPPNQLVSVKEMARMLSMSRSRLYQLIKQGVLLGPIYDVESKRPFYSSEMIARNLEAKRTNCGINGQAMLFYTPRKQQQARAARAPRRQNRSNHADLIEGLKALGMEATEAAVDAALRSLYPADRGAATDEGERLRAVFRHLRRSNRVENRERNVGA